MEKNSFKNNVRTYLQLFKYIRHYWGVLLLGMFATACFSGLDASFAYLLKPILNKGFISKESEFIKILPFLLILLFFFRATAYFISNYSITFVARGIVMEMRQTIFAHLIELPAKYYDKTDSGKALSLLLFNVEQLAEASSSALTEFLQSICLIIGLIVVMFIISWQLSLFNLIMFPLIILCLRLCNNRMRRVNNDIQENMADITSITKESIFGYKIIRIFAGKNHQIKKFNKLVRDNRSRELKIVVTKSVSTAIVQFLATLVLAFTVYLAIAENYVQLSPGSFIAFITALFMLIKPLKSFTNVNAAIQRGLCAAESIFNFLKISKEENKGKIKIKSKGKISFENVSFKYGKESFALQNITFTIKPYQKIALVGHSGGGKTTLVNILQRFYDNYSGIIKLDDIDTKELDLVNLRQQFSFVSQNIILFNDTIFNNIAYGDLQRVKKEKIFDAVKAAGIWDFIDQLELKLDTPIGEDGVLLSGGQKQRLAIARALVKKAPIIILDEATSSLDTILEKEVQKSLNKLMQNRTVLIIAHRLSTIKNVDTILVLEDGCLIEQGNHQELIEKNQTYAKLCKTQYFNTD